jgi:ribonuclease BN (tRNA processing enzyme)
MSIQLRILGASGGTTTHGGWKPLPFAWLKGSSGRAMGMVVAGGSGHRLETTSFLVNETILLDAGTGVGILSLNELQQIRHILVTHSHLDHVASIAFMADSLFETTTTPILVHTSEETIAALKTHLFNNILWPDFTTLVNPLGIKVIEFVPFSSDAPITIDGLSIEMIPVSHTVPAVGYRIESGTHSFAYTGDTMTNDTFWEAINRHQKLDMLITECAFPVEMKEIAALSKHYDPDTLAADLNKLEIKTKVFLTHFKPGKEETILNDLRERVRDIRIKPLMQDDTYQLK